MRFWLEERSEPIDTAETRFLNAPDLISLACRRKSFFRRRLEQHVLTPLVGAWDRSASARSSRARGVTSPPEVPDGGTSCQDEPDGATSWQDELTDVAGKFCVLIAAVCMLIAPLWILPPMGNQLDKKLGTITAFLLLFLILMQWGTASCSFEVLAATAG